MAGDAATAAELWDTIASEVERLTSGRKRGVNFSEDFAVDRVCTALDKLRQQHATAPREAADKAVVEELVGLRVELAMGEQRQRMQQAKIEEAHLQVRQARESRVELERELAEEEAGRTVTSDLQARQWRDAASESHARLSALRALELEAAQLEEACSRPAGSAEGSLVAQLQADLDAARAEAQSAERELQALSAERSHLERRLDLEARLSPSRTTQPAEAAQSSVLSGLAGLGANTESKEPTVRDELLRIASRASENVRTLQEAMAGLSSSAAKVELSSAYAAGEAGVPERSFANSQSSATAAFLSSDLGRGGLSGLRGIQALDADRISQASGAPGIGRSELNATRDSLHSRTGLQRLAAQSADTVQFGGRGSIRHFDSTPSAASQARWLGELPSFRGLEGKSVSALQDRLSELSGLSRGRQFETSSDHNFQVDGSHGRTGYFGNSSFGASGHDAMARAQSSDLPAASMLRQRAQLGLDSSASVLDEAHRVLQKMEQLSSMRAASAAGAPLH